MRNHVLLRQASVAVLAMSLAACGGGGVSSTPSPPPTGGGTPTPSTPTPTTPTPTTPTPTTPTPTTPTPTPPATGTNSSLTGTLQSETFANAAMRTTANFTASGTTGQVQTVTATFSYNAATQSYSLATPTGSITFTPADIDAAQSSAGAVVYQKVNGNTVDSLTLTRPGTSGPLTYQYVGGAFWQHAVQTSATSVSGSIDALTYGVVTPNAAVPRSGSANYALDLIGAHADFGALNGLAGAANASVDFGSGSIIVLGTMAMLDASGAVGRLVDVGGRATISSSANSFTGTFAFAAGETFEGSLKGMLFGPAAQEFGAVFSTKAAGNGTVATGILIGRQGPPDAGNASFDSNAFDELGNSQTFATSEAIIDFNFNGTIGFNEELGDFSAIGKRTSPLLIRYDEAQDVYALADADFFAVNEGLNGFRSEGYLGPSDTASWNGVDTNFLGQTLQYVRQRRWIHADGDGTVPQYRIAHMVYGMDTPFADLPLTGSAGYRIRVNGTAADIQFRNPMAFLGDGDLYVDFATGKITAYAPLTFSEMASLSGLAGEVRAGSFAFDATLSSAANSFSGNVTVEGLGAYAGTGSGRFFGPDADEVGGIFSASKGANGALAGSFAGLFDSSVTDPTAPVLGLADLAGPTDLTFSFVGKHPFPGDFKSVNYDPTTDTYVIGFRFGGSSDDQEITVTPAGFDAGESTAMWDAYTGDLLGEPYRIRFPTAALPITLTYASFAEYGFEDHPGPNYDERAYLVFGVQPRQMPRTGSATYRGIAIAEAEVLYGGGRNDFYALTGTSLLQADFSMGTFDLTLQGLSGDREERQFFFDRGAAYASLTLGDISYSGTIDGASFKPSMVSSTNNLVGGFFGPNAEEFAAAFKYQGAEPFGDPFGSMNLHGVAAGKKE